MTTTFMDPAENEDHNREEDFDLAPERADFNSDRQDELDADLADESDLYTGDEDAVYDQPVGADDGIAFDATPGEYKEDADLDPTDDPGLAWANRDDEAYREATETVVVADEPAYDESYVTEGEPLTVENTPSEYEGLDDRLAEERREDDRSLMEKAKDKIDEWTGN